MDLKKTMNTDFLGSWDFKAGEKKVLTVKEIVEKKIYNPNKNKEEMTTVMYFTNHTCGMILNSTNKKRLIKLFETSETENYHGKNVQLITIKIKVRGDEMEGIRVDTTLPAQPVPPQAKTKEVLNEDHKAWEPACNAISDGSITIDQIKKKYELTDQTVAKLKSHETIQG